MPNKKSIKHRKKKRKSSGCLVVLLAGIVFAACIYFTYTKFSESSPYINAEATASPTVNSSIPTVAPNTSSKASANTSKNTSSKNSKNTANPSSPSPKPTQKSEKEKSTSKPSSLKTGELVEYSNDIYGFSCPYFSSFSEYIGEAPDALISLRAPEGSAYEHIFATDDTSSSPTSEMREFISSYPTASILENRAGNDYFYALIKYDDMYIYRYAVFTDDTEKGFEFGYSENTKSTYSDYPAEIKDNFILY